MSIVSTVGLIGFALGLALVCLVAYVAGRKGWWWLAVLISVPAVGGGLMALSTDMSQMSFIFRNFLWLVITQLGVTFVAYVAGRRKRTTPNDDVMGGK